MDDAMPPEPRRHDLIATMAFDPLAGIVELDQHLATLKNEAAALDCRFDRHAVRNELQAATFRLRAPATLRLLVSPTGALAIEATPDPGPNS